MKEVGSETTRFRPGDEVFYAGDITRPDTNAALIKPRGHVALIDAPKALDVVPLKSKALSVSWEFMFTRSMFQTEDMDAQHMLLNGVADLLHNGTLIPTVNKHGGTLSVENLRSAHELQESGAAIGNTVLDGFSQ
ncbi:MAG: zinc-binding dehydrogenase [Gammaproteobacteria bacterium]|nr:zinc-binding dehydrogenase [Gammaproteobacteria bacterium]